MGFQLSIDVVSQFAHGPQLPAAINTRVGNLGINTRQIPINRFIDQLTTCSSDVVLFQDLPDAAVESVLRKLSAAYRAHNYEPRQLADGDDENSEHALLASLTPRQREVLAFIAKGFTLKETARLMNLSPKSVDSHMHRIRNRLGIHDRVHLALFAVRTGLIDP